MSKQAELERVCDLLDKLTLDALTLIEESIQIKINLENAMTAGSDHLAKSRYISGHNSISALQVPSTSDGVKALATVYSEESESLFGQKEFDLQVSNAKDDGIVDPINWFGVLVPQNLHFARNMFRTALQWAVNGVNTQTRLTETCKKIEQLKIYKNELSSEAS